VPKVKLINVVLLGSAIQELGMGSKAMALWHRSRVTWNREAILSPGGKK
jgi:hypothetical protein